MAIRKKTKGQTMIYKAPYKILKIKQHDPHEKSGVDNLGASEG
jgi:hypothetical protein